MFVKKLHLKDFRLFPEKLFEFKQDAVVLVGPNASGKTAVMEAIYLLSAGQSFRADKVEEMIGFNQDLARVKAKIYPDGSTAEDDLGGLDELQLSLMLTKGQVNGKRTQKKLYSVNDNRRRKKDFTGKLLAVIFRPEDMRLVEGSPGRRRDFLDLPLQLTDQYYVQASTQYAKALRRRNKLLSLVQEKQQPASVLTYWDMSLVKHGELIQKKRRQFIDFINANVEPPLPMQIQYQPSIISKQRIKDHRQSAIAAGFTLIGPHKDDFFIELDFADSKESKESPSNHQPLDAYGSRGQKRMGVLWLKKAELMFLRSETQRRPVLLLDDILSELDAENRQKVLQLIDGEQTFITTVDKDLIDEIEIKFPDYELIELDE